MTVPAREDWPVPKPASADGEALTELVLTTFRLNAALLDAAQGLAEAGGITAAWWQVLGGVLDGPQTVAETGRRMGLSRQAVQRIADRLVDQGLAEYRPNPAHRRAQLLACTEAGYWSIRRISVVQHPWAARVGGKVGADRIEAARQTMIDLLGALGNRD